MRCKAFVLSGSVVAIIDDLLEGVDVEGLVLMAVELEQVCESNWTLLLLLHLVARLDVENLFPQKGLSVHSPCRSVTNGQVKFAHKFVCLAALSKYMEVFGVGVLVLQVNMVDIQLKRILLFGLLARRFLAVD